MKMRRSKREEEGNEKEQNRDKEESKEEKERKQRKKRMKRHREEEEEKQKKEKRERGTERRKVGLRLSTETLVSVHSFGDGFAPSSPTAPSVSAPGHHRFSGCNNCRSFAGLFPQWPLFLIFINDIAEKCVGCDVALYADDIAIWPHQPIYGNKQIDKIQLSNSLRGFSEWAADWRMLFNVKKSCVFSSETRAENKMMIPQSRTSPSPSPVNSSRSNHQPATSEWCFTATATGTATLTSSSPKFAMQWTASAGSYTKGSIRLFLSSVSWSRLKSTPSSPTASQWSGTMSLRPKSSTASSSSPSSDLSLLSQRPAMPLSSSPPSSLMCSLSGRRRQSAMLTDCIVSLDLLLLLSSSETISDNQIADLFPPLLPSTLFPLHRNSVRWKNNFTSIMTDIFHRRTSNEQQPLTWSQGCWPNSHNPPSSTTSILTSIIRRI